MNVKKIHSSNCYLIFSINTCINTYFGAFRVSLQAPFIEVVKVLDHAHVPIIKAVFADEGGEDGPDGPHGHDAISGRPGKLKLKLKVDISIDGPTHTGLATSAFVCYLAEHLPNLVPLTIIFKSLLQVPAG